MGNVLFRSLLWMGLFLAIVEVLGHDKLYYRSPAWGQVVNEECEDLSVVFWAMLTGKDIMIQWACAVCWLIPKTNLYALLLLALPSVGFLFCGFMLDFAENRGIPFSPQFLHMIHNATEATAYCSFILATWCEEWYECGSPRYICPSLKRNP